jgi:hypothetical protein
MPNIVKFVGMALLLAVTILSILGIYWFQHKATPLPTDGGGMVILGVCAASGLAGLWVLGTAKSRLQ